MKKNLAACLLVALAFGCFATEASAQRRFGSRLSRAPVGRPMTILPTRAEIRAVPAPGRGRVVGYALNMYPSTRLARLILGR